MAEYKRKINRKKLTTVFAYTILGALMLLGASIGFVIGRHLAPPAQVEVINVSTHDHFADDAIILDVPLSDNMQRYICEICGDNGVPVSLVLAIIEHESQFNADEISSTNDYGLMQINAINHDWLREDYHCRDMLNPYQNVFCGIQILGSYLDAYDGDIARSLMAYNMGSYGAKAAWENGITSTAYTEHVIELMGSYEEALRNEQK